MQALVIVDPLDETRQVGRNIGEGVILSDVDRFDLQGLRAMSMACESGNRAQSSDMRPIKGAP